VPRIPQTPLYGQICLFVWVLKSRYNLQLFAPPFIRKFLQLYLLLLVFLSFEKPMFFAEKLDGESLPRPQNPVKAGRSYRPPRQRREAAFTGFSGVAAVAVVVAAVFWAKP